MPCIHPRRVAGIAPFLRHRQTAARLGAATVGILFDLRAPGPGRTTVIAQDYVSDHGLPVRGQGAGITAQDLYSLDSHRRNAGQDLRQPVLFAARALAVDQHISGAAAEPAAPAALDQAKARQLVNHVERIDRPVNFEKGVRIDNAFPVFLPGTVLTLKPWQPRFGCKACFGHERG